MANSFTFSQAQLDRIAKVVGDLGPELMPLSMIARKVELIGAPALQSANATKWRYLAETFEAWQRETGDSGKVVELVQLTVEHVVLNGTPDQCVGLLEALNRVLNHHGYMLKQDGTLVQGAAATITFPHPSSVTPAARQLEKGPQVHVPLAIQDSLQRFRARHPNERKIGFIMMHFGSTPAHITITRAIKSVLGAHGLVAVRADEQEYHPETFSNIQTYMHGCGFGIAVFERLESEILNANVSLEVGYMYALDKRVCLIKDKNLKTLQADLMGRLYRPFDPQNIEASLKPELENWLQSYDLI